LKKTSEFRVTEEQSQKLKIVSGPVMVHVSEQQLDVPPAQED
jgi:hypothetical protein